MQRPAQILLQLETSLSAAPESLARAVGVGLRTVATEVSGLNASLGGSAQVRLIGGRYRLRVVDQEAYRARRADVLGVRDSFNDPAHRSAHILCQLAGSLLPVRIESLAHQMNVGRTTVTADLAALRRLVEPLGVRIQGRPHVGLSLTGDELGIRLAVLRHAGTADHQLLDPASPVASLLDEACRVHDYDRTMHDEVARWLVVQERRLCLGHEVASLPSAHAALSGTPAHLFAIDLAAGMARVTGQDLAEAEVLYLALPVSGRRPAPSSSLTTMDRLEPCTRELVAEIFEQIREQLEVDLQPHELLGEFGTHLQFMLNRLRFGLGTEIRQDLPELRERFPLAHRMAEVAAVVVRERTGLAMDDTELSLAATYFQVFLDDQASRRRRPFRVGILSRRGPAAASLLQAQLTKALALPTEYVPLTSADEVDAAGVDLVVASPGSSLDVTPPVIELTEFFDRRELLNKLSRMRFHDFGPLPMDDPDGSMLLYLLDEDRLVQLPAGTTYDQAVGRLAGRLASLGMVDGDFLDALCQRVEEQEPIVIGGGLGFPHASSDGLSAVTCALGIVEPGGVADGLRAVFLMGVPEKADYDDRILIRAYEELIRLGTDARLMDRLQTITTYPELLGLLEDMREHNQGS